jgi:pimeloyl-ACP methyl ester carboxylesterase
MIAGIAPSLHAVRAGSGPRLVLVHGSAADHATWSIQLASPLRERFTLVAYDRRREATSVEDHRDDLAHLIEGEPGPALVAGSSFGAVVVLDLARTRPELCRGIVLIEPPMSPSDEVAVHPTDFLDELDRLAAASGHEAAAERFLRTVLGDTAFERMPRAFQDRAKSKWLAIRADSGALAVYRPRYAELGQVAVPALLLGGERSAAYFRPTLEALRTALPAARLEIVAGAGHMLHAEASRRFAELVVEFAAAVDR